MMQTQFACNEINISWKKKYDEIPRFWDSQSSPPDFSDAFQICNIEICNPAKWCVDTAVAGLGIYAFENARIFSRLFTNVGNYM